MKRRTFLKTASTAAGLGVGLGTLPVSAATFSVALVTDPADPVVFAAPVKWAMTELLGRLHDRKIDCRLIGAVGEATPGETCVVVSGPTLRAPGVMPGASRPPAAAESYALTNATISGRKVIVAAGRDRRGLVYALLELIDRIEYEATPIAAFQLAHSMVEQPANRIRSVLRAFVSEVEDKPWFYDRVAWKDYLTMLATNRFNRLNLSFGIGYDFVNEIRDSYFHFAYPFFLNVPGYNVQVAITSRFGGPPELLGEEEKARNLSLLQFISGACAERGMDFQLGLWTHAWNFDETPNASHRITGLTAATHANYCRDALHALLMACPAITGVTLRTHGESGVPEQSYPFWKTVFSGIVATGRKIEIDQHAKGIDDQMILMAQATEMPTTISPKYWAEHMGLPYHQAAIRPTEMPKAAAGRDKTGALMALSNGSRNFLRYGYGDLLREDRRYSVLHRIWPGTQRLLLWGDPLMAKAYGRASSFSGSDGVEWMEPLSFKGRKGSGTAGGRDGYAGAVSPDVRDWDKYLYTYRVWGRNIYNPESTGDARARFLRKRLGAAAEAGAGALALSSRILPTITTAHMPSAANANYWPEIYTNQSIVTADAKDPYGDTPSPRRFGTVSPLDSRLFCTVDQCAAELVSGQRSASYSPIEVATWLESLATDSESDLAAVETGEGATPEFRLWAVDITIQNQIGRFFGSKFRAAVLFSIYQRTGDPAAQEEAVNAYTKARDAWKKIGDVANGVYRTDLAFGYAPQLRGTWKDRLAAIEQDIAVMRAAKSTALPPSSATAVIVTALATTHRQAVTLVHAPQSRFRVGIPVVITASLPATATGKLNLCYRRVNQSESWVTVPMESGPVGFHATIPAAYLNSPFPLQYYFEVHPDVGDPVMYPGLARDYSVQPYFLIRKV